MLQLFLQSFIPAMEEGVMLTVPLGILLAILDCFPERNFRGTFWRSIKWGIFISLFFTAVKMGTRQAVSREGFEAFAIFVSILSALMLLAILPSYTGDEKRAKAVRFAAVVLAVGFFCYHGMEIWLMPVSIAVAATGELFTPEVLVKSLGFGGGVFVGMLSGYLVYKASAALSYKRKMFVYAVQAVACIIQQGIYLIQVLMIRRVIGGAAVMKTMGPLIDNQRLLIFAVFFVTFLVPVTLYLQPKPERPAWANPAEYRKILAAAKHKLRWGTGVIAALVVMVLMSSVGYSFATKEAELVPAIPVAAENGFVSVPIADVEDGHLHRYSYRTQSSVTVRFIIIRKGGNAYGVGLDACEICGPTGYIEREDQVVCKLCDVVMNKATIGLPGGCNPIPLEYKVENGGVRISKENLEKAKKHFR